MKTLDQLTKDERSLLLFLETRAVDYGGRVKTPRMNGQDFDTAAEWSKQGFIRFGRIAARYNADNDYGTHWVELSAEAWQLAHEERRARYARLNKSRTWKTTEEHRAEP